jgi:copper chaperone NosL
VPPNVDDTLIQKQTARLTLKALHCLGKGVVTLTGKKLSIVSSILILLAAGLIVASLFYPWWAMKFIAPQYPEGLNIIVYPDKLEGEIDIVNGLNHYIGMSEFSEENFPELNYLKYLIGGLAALTALTAILRRKAILYGLIGLFVAGGALGVWDLHRWLKNFGTKLDPMAPIKVDPFIPPIIGENTLANFITYSTLQPGTYFIIAAFVLLLIPLWKDRKQ